MASDKFLPSVSPAPRMGLVPQRDAGPLLDAAAPAIATAPNGRQITALSGRQKAAILVRLLLAEGADIKLSSLPEDIQTALTEQIGRMRLVDRDTMVAVISEFVETLEQVGISFPSGIDGAMRALEGKLSPGATTRLRQLSRQQEGADPWARIQQATAAELLETLEGESAEVAAVVLSKLPVSRAAELLGKMPGERARRVAYAISLTEGIDPRMVARIGGSIATELDRRPPPAFAAPSTARVGAILNSATGHVRDAVLSALQDEDGAFADGVRKAIFTFGHIRERVSKTDVPKVLREVPQDRLIVALAAALPVRDSPEAVSADFLLANMSQRMAATLREEVEVAGRIKPKEGEAAMAEVVAAIRRLVDSGDIALVSDEEDE